MKYSTMNKVKLIGFILLILTAIIVGLFGPIDLLKIVLLSKTVMIFSIFWFFTIMTMISIDIYVVINDDREKTEPYYNSTITSPNITWS